MKVCELVKLVKKSISNIEMDCHMNGVKISVPNCMSYFIVFNRKDKHVYLAEKFKPTKEPDEYDFYVSNDKGTPLSDIKHLKPYKITSDKKIKANILKIAKQIKEINSEIKKQEIAKDFE